VTCSSQVFLTTTEKEITMSIANAVQRGSWVHVYNEKNQEIFAQSAGNGPNDGLKGYTSNSVNIQRGGWIYTYNEKGSQTGVMPAR
jgi:hypothetical protein